MNIMQMQRFLRKESSVPFWKPVSLTFSCVNYALFSKQMILLSTYPVPKFKLNAKIYLYQKEILAFMPGLVILVFIFTFPPMLTFALTPPIPIPPFTFILVFMPIPPL
jgi:hypothetical protein